MAKDPQFKSEQEAAAQVVAYLEEGGHSGYQEVELGSGVADIVTLNGREVWVIEVKMTWSLDLLQQLWEHRRRGHGHRIFAAVPYTKNHYEREMLFRSIGFGVITIFGPEDWKTRRKTTQITTMAPRLTSKPLPHIVAKLDEGHKTHAKAGAPGAVGRWTPFRRTCEALAAIVYRSPGILMKDAMKDLKHHYSSDASARNCLLRLIQDEAVPDVHAVIEGKLLKLYPKKPDPVLPLPSPIKVPTPLPPVDDALPPEDPFECVSAEDLI